MRILSIRKKIRVYFARFLSFYPIFLSIALLFFKEVESVELLIPSVISVYPHDKTAFTQGLAIHQEHLYESTGLYGHSTLKQFNLHTLSLINKKALPSHYFAEGIAIVGDQVIQLTWQEKTAFVYSLPPMKLKKTYAYTGEGWGLCYDGQSLFMSNGSDTITVRSSETFHINKQFRVHLNKQYFNRLNDLECVGNALYANIWGKNTILKIDKHTGNVLGLIDASNLLTEAEKQMVGPEGVLNGIAYDSKSQTFFITGKNWPWLFQVVFIPK